MESVLVVCQDDDIYHLLSELYPTYKFITSNDGRNFIEYLKTKVNAYCLRLILYKHLYEQGLIILRSSEL